MKFTYYSKKSTTAGVCFFTIRTDNDDEQLRINTLTRKYEMYTLLNFDCEVGVFDESITNIQSARKLYNQIKQEAKNLKEDELVQRYYFTYEDGEEVWECFATPEDAYNKAKELANEYNSDICINTVIGEDIVDFACPDDEPETEEATPEVTALSEKPEQSDAVPETANPEFWAFCCFNCMRFYDCLKTIRVTDCDSLCYKCDFTCDDFEDIPSPVEEPEQPDDVLETASSDELLTENATPEVYIPEVTAPVEEPEKSEEQNVIISIGVHGATLSQCFKQLDENIDYICEQLKKTRQEYLNTLEITSETEPAGYVPETIPAEEPEQPDDVPETSSSDELLTENATPEVYIPEFPLPFKEPETKPKQLYYFTDEDGRKLFESFETPCDAYYLAKELANSYDIIIFVNTVDDGIVDFVSPDELPF